MLLKMRMVGEVGVSSRVLVHTVSLLVSEGVGELCSAVGELHP